MSLYPCFVKPRLERAVVFYPLQTVVHALRRIVVVVGG